MSKFNIDSFALDLMRKVWEIGNGREPESQRKAQIQVAIAEAVEPLMTKQQAEPVRWMYEDGSVGDIDCGHTCIPLYTAPQAQPAPIPTAWQPIETAPKDGTAIIVGAGCYPVQPSTVIWVSDPSVSACAPVWFINYKSKTMFGESIALFPIDYDPTHWQPLPLPPAPGGEG